MGRHAVGIDVERLLLTIPEAAASCGVDRATFYRWLRNRTVRLPIVRIGGTVRVRTADLERFLAELAEVP
jgi:excisionase family DNA binding protein